MSDYNFDEDDKLFDKTVRLDDINKKVQDREGPDIEKTQVLPPLPPQKKEGAFYSDKETKAPPSPAKTIDSRKKMILFAVFIGLIIFVAVFVVTMVSFHVPEPEIEKPAALEPAAQTETSKGVCLVKNINTSKELSLYNIDEKENFSLYLDSETLYKNQDNPSFSFQDIHIGDVFEIEWSEENLVVRLEKTKDISVLENATGFQISVEDKKITGQEKEYSFTDETVFLYDNKFIDSRKIEPADVVTLWVYKDTVWSMKVTQSHGYLEFINSSTLPSLTLTIDDQNIDSTLLGDKNKIPLSPGPHKIAVTGENMEPYSLEVYIIVGETFPFDLSSAQLKKGVVVLKANVEGYELYLNDTLQEDTTKPLVLSYGTYHMKAVKDGYKTWEGDFTLAEESKEITILLEEDIKKGIYLISSDPKGASVTIDGNFVGIAPVSTELTYGEHRLEVKMEGYTPFSGPITMEKPQDEITVLLQ